MKGRSSPAHSLGVRLLGIAALTSGLLCMSLGPLSHHVATALPAVAAGRPTSKPRAATLLAAYGRLPLRFEVNDGQAGPHVRFLARGAGFTFFLTGSGAELALQSHQARTRPHGGMSAQMAIVRLDLAGARANSAVVGLDRLPGTTNYLLGNDPRRWRTNVASYARSGSWRLPRYRPRLPRQPGWIPSRRNGGV